MPNIWKQNQDVNERPNRNNFGLRFQNHLTMKMGTIYPIMCKPVVPGDSFKIDTAFGLKFMPLVFPVQSHMRAHVHYFYVPNRLIWKNWKNFISGLEEHEHPYISQPTSWFKTGSLCDYLDVPTTTAGSGAKLITLESRSNNYSISYATGRARGGRTGFTTEVGSVEVHGIYSYAFDKTGTDVILTGGDVALANGVISSPAAVSDGAKLLFYDCPLPLLNENFNPQFNFETHSAFASDVPVTLYFWVRPKNSPVPSLLPNSGAAINFSTMFTGMYCPWSAPGKLVLNANNTTTFASFVPTGDIRAICDYARYLQLTGNYDIYISFGTTSALIPGPGSLTTKTAPIGFSGRFRLLYDNIVVDDATATPFANDIEGMEGEPVERISALPFRAYEAVYNSYFRNTQNQPFYVNDEPVYNQWNTTLEDGADTTDYQLMRRNYELDFLTSALPSPQFGTAPLVGMSALGNITIEDENGVSTYQATVDNDGNITKVVATSPTASIEHARTAMNIAAVGMNINDFRATNSFQKFLETTLRKGYRYKDFVMGHFGISPKQLELDMPLYIGGVSQDVSVNMISNMTAGQTIENEQVPLGAFAGTANCFGSSKHTVSHFCDDWGFIIGVMCIVPDPAYSQLLPKHFLHSQQLDYYFHEFSNLGLQPITYREVCPLTAYQDYLLDSDMKLTDTFGYQRPNYDLVGYTDQVHGLFRTQLKDFLVNRIFAHRPELGTDFLEIKPEEVNDIFAYRKSSDDTIIGQIIVDVKAKRPVPRIVIPGLGR